MNQRRLRASQHMRDLAASVYLSVKDFIQPVFVDETITERSEVNHLPGVFAETIESLLYQTEKDIKNGINKFLLFPVPATKATHTFNFDFAATVNASLKTAFGDAIWLANDVCLCSYTTHGHCGVLNQQQTKLLNNETVDVLAQYALVLAQSGSNCIAPSDMSDGRIAAIRATLNNTGLDDVAIMSYAAKFASSLYGPFRDVCKSSPDGDSELKDRKSYQLDFRNPKDAIASAIRDGAEGGDILMVKPATLYLDIVQSISQQINKPIAVYHVSGEYAALEMLAQQQLASRAALHIEAWTAFKRAGANAIISYAAREAAGWIK